MCGALGTCKWSLVEDLHVTPKLSQQLDCETAARRRLLVKRRFKWTELMAGMQPQLDENMLTVMRRREHAELAGT